MVVDYLAAVLGGLARLATVPIRLDSRALS
jgi:hypothetical protein